MAEEELAYEDQLDEITTRVNRYREHGIQPEAFLLPTFLNYFLVVMEPGVLTDIKWSNVLGLFIRSLVLPMTYVDNDELLAMSQQHVWEATTAEEYYPR